MAHELVFRMKELLEQIFAASDDDDLRLFRTINRQWRDVASRTLRMRDKPTAVTTRWATSTPDRLALSGMAGTTPPEAVIRRACTHSHLETAQWADARYAPGPGKMQGLEDDYLRLDKPQREQAAPSPVLQACKYGTADVAIWLIARYDIKYADEYMVAACENKTGQQLLAWLCLRYNKDGEALHDLELLRVACVQGNVQTAQLIAAMVEQKTASALHQAMESLPAACLGGHTEVAEWLITKFGMTANTSDYMNDNALVLACYTGTSAMARWLVDRLQLTDVHPECQLLSLRAAMIFSDVELLSWLTDRFAIAALGEEWGGNKILHDAYRVKHMSSLEWVVNSFDLTAEDARRGNNQALIMACVEQTPRALEVAQWLTDRFGLTREDLLERSGDALIHACENSARDGTKVRWMVERFGLTAADIYGRNFRPESAYDLCESGELKAWLDSRFVG